MEQTKKLKVVVTERKTEEGRTFNVFNTYSKNGRKMELKFRKEVKNIPDKNCHIICKIDDIHVNTSNEYPVVWVKGIQEIISNEDEYTEANRTKVNEFFD